MHSTTARCSRLQRRSRHTVRHSSREGLRGHPSWDHPSQKRSHAKQLTSAVSRGTHPTIRGCPEPVSHAMLASMVAHLRSALLSREQRLCCSAQLARQASMVGPFRQRAPTHLVQKLSHPPPPVMVLDDEQPPVTAWNAPSAASSSGTTIRRMGGSVMPLHWKCAKRRPLRCRPAT